MPTRRRSRRDDRLCRRRSVPHKDDLVYRTHNSSVEQGLIEKPRLADRHDDPRELCSP